MKMILKFYFSILILWTLKYVLTHYHNYADFNLYLVEVVKHIIYHNQLQEKITSWHDVNTTDEFKILLSTSLNKNHIDFILSPEIVSSIIISMNCRYAKLLKLYDRYIMTMISECENYYNIKLFDKFIECTKLIQDVVCNSSGMFKNLYDILTFLINLDVKFIFHEYVAPITIINEIHTVYTYTSSKKKSCMFTYITSSGDFDTDDACKDILNIKHFQAKVSDMLHNHQFLDTASNLTSDFVDKYLIEKSKGKYVLQKEKDKSYIQFIYDDLIIFYNEVIANDNCNLGFQELLNPTIPGLVPPMILKNTEQRIATLKTLFSKRHFKEPFKNIKIVIDHSEKLDASYLLQTVVNSENLYHKEKYFVQLLRCRYAEILKKYVYLVDSIINFCRIEEIKGNIHKYKERFVECVNQLRNSISLSVNMLESLLSAMAILKKLYIWEYVKNVHNCLHIPATIITELFYDLKALNIGPYVDTKTINEIQATAYLDQLSKFHKKLKKGLRSELGSRVRFRCEFLDNYTDTLKIKKLCDMNLSNKHNGPVYELFCSHINIFCNEIIDTDYKNLGFKDLI
ncbi:uncharacterized protein LOC126898714 [Daktulosphaira vitifoliae]|uniref:uncharacterized protein LOC126898714 n=1 Tax=Daktulosphaira vitifoliae TaxID=58002 RepID=UPI0021AAE0E3|nr:uncharacterized protein LOC126898714 [Daktulosphaira vitifoliae]